MNGEIAIKVDKVRFSNDMEKPYPARSANIGPDMSLISEKESLHICGNNDWGYLMTDALLPLLKYAEAVFEKIRIELSKYDGTPEVIILGNNEYRAVDISHRLQRLGDPIEIFHDIPVVKGKDNNIIKLVGKVGSSEELPLSY